MLKNSRKKSGQALAELAIFGTVLLGVFGFLLNYGLNYNYSENIQMVSFRRALDKAYEARATYNTSNVLVLKDKPIPDPGNTFGISSRFPVLSSGSAVWSNDLMLSWGRADFGRRDMLNKIVLIVGEKEYNFTVAGWVEKPFEEITTIREKKNDHDDMYLLDGSSGSDGIFWYWKTVAISAVAANNDYDVDNDDKLETVISKAGRMLKYLDFQEGEIDGSINTKDIRRGEFPTSGLTGEYEEKKKLSTAQEPNTKLLREEDRMNINTREELNVEDNFYHLVRLNRITDSYTGVDYVTPQLQDGDWIDYDNKFFWIKVGINQQISQRWATPK